VYGGGGGDLTLNHSEARTEGAEPRRGADMVQGQMSLPGPRATGGMPVLPVFVCYVLQPQVLSQFFQHFVKVQRLPDRKASFFGRRAWAVTRQEKSKL
jgi:hypothetical protein